MELEVKVETQTDLKTQQDINCKKKQTTTIERKGYSNHAMKVTGGVVSTNRKSLFIVFTFTFATTSGLLLILCAYY